MITMARLRRNISMKCQVGGCCVLELALELELEAEVLQSDRKVEDWPWSAH